MDNPKRAEYDGAMAHLTAALSLAARNLCVDPNLPGDVAAFGDGAGWKARSVIAARDCMFLIVPAPASGGVR